MVQALVNINENVNRVLNIVKAKHDFKDKGQAIEFVVNQFVEMENEPLLKSEFIEKMKKIEKQKSIKVDDFANRYGLD